MFLPPNRALPRLREGTEAALARQGGRSAASAKRICSYKKELQAIRKNLGCADRRLRRYLSIRYFKRLADFGFDPSVGSVGDSYDDALADTIIGLYKTEVIHHGPWRTMEAVEYATLDRANWFDRRRLLEPIGNEPSAELELECVCQRSEQAVQASLKANSLRRSWGGSPAPAKA